LPLQPLNDSDWDWYTSEVASLSSANPVEDSEVFSGEFQTWADQSYDIAVNDVYAGK
jgi:hypothetical protein